MSSDSNSDETFTKQPQKKTVSKIVITKKPIIKNDIINTDKQQQKKTVSEITNTKKPIIKNEIRKIDKEIPNKKYHESLKPTSNKTSKFKHSKPKDNTNVNHIIDNTSPIVQKTKEQQRTNIITLYEYLCNNTSYDDEYDKEMKIDGPWPIDVAKIRNFLLFLLNHLAYTKSKISTIIKEIYKKNIEEQHESLSEKDLMIIAKIVSDHNKNHTYITGSEPCIYSTLKHILESIPYFYIQKTYMYSVCLFSFYSGSRFISIRHIRLKDISYTNKELHIIVTHTKNNPKWNQRIRFTGELNEELERVGKTTQMSFIYWLNQYIFQYFGIQLQLINVWNKKDENKLKSETSLWFPIRAIKDNTVYKGQTGENTEYRQDYHGLQVEFNKVVKSSGLSDSKITLHSLRSGRICSEIITNGIDTNDFSTVIKSTGYLANWAPNSTAQMGYIKEALKATIICNRLQTTKPVISKDMTTIKNFHKLEKEPIPNWQSHLKLEIFHQDKFKVLSKIMLDTKLIGAQATLFQNRINNSPWLPKAILGKYLNFDLDKYYIEGKSRISCNAEFIENMAVELKRSTEIYKKILYNYIKEFIDFCDKGTTTNILEFNIDQMDTINLKEPYSTIEWNNIKTLDNSDKKDCNFTLFRKRILIEREKITEKYFYLTNDERKTKFNLNSQWKSNIYKLINSYILVEYYYPTLKIDRQHVESEKIKLCEYTIKATLEDIDNNKLLVDQFVEYYSNYNKYLEEKYTHYLNNVNHVNYDINVSNSKPGRLKTNLIELFKLRQYKESNKTEESKTIEKLDLTKKPINMLNKKSLELYKQYITNEWTLSEFTALDSDELLYFNAKTALNNYASYDYRYPLSIDTYNKYIDTLMEDNYSYTVVRSYGYYIVMYNHIEYKPKVEKLKARETFIQNENTMKTSLIKKLAVYLKDCPEYRGKDPCTITDVMTFINMIPYLYKYKEADISLYLFSSYTASRYHSIKHIQLQDISQAETSDSKNDNFIVRINVRVTKTRNYTENHKSIEGRLHENNTSNQNNTIIDFVYWLDQHLKLNFNLKLSKCNTWNTDKKYINKYLWSSEKSQNKIRNYTTNSKRFKKFVAIKEIQTPIQINRINCNRLTFHSLRSGFVTSVMQINNVKGKNVYTYGPIPKVWKYM